MFQLVPKLSYMKEVNITGAASTVDVIFSFSGDFKVNIKEFLPDMSEANLNFYVSVLLSLDHYANDTNVMQTGIYVSLLDDQAAARITAFTGLLPNPIYVIGNLELITTPNPDLVSKINAAKGGRFR